MSLHKLVQALEYQERYEQKINDAVDFLKEYIQTSPLFGLVLGSGLGDIAAQITNATIIPYQEIPHFPRPTVLGHEGKLYLGKIEEVPILGLQGRKHYYEVADELCNTGMLQVIFPVHVLASLGISNYFVTNAAGGLNTTYNVGDIMIIMSHINCMPNPLLGRQHDLARFDGTPVWRFQPMNDAYDKEFRDILTHASTLYRSNVHHGVYAAVTGPSYEATGECIALRALGADAVGMSTTPEVIVARNRGMRVVGFSCITNIIAPDGTNAANHKEVTAILESPETKNRLATIVHNFFRLQKKS